PNRPANDTVWIDGEWVWQRPRWAWRSGRWVVPPKGARFSPWVMVRAEDGAIYCAPGTWRDAEGREIADPQALATGTSGAGEVVNPEGQREKTDEELRWFRGASPPADGGERTWDGGRNDSARTSSRGTFRSSGRQSSSRTFRSSRNSTRQSGKHSRTRC